MQVFETVSELQIYLKAAQKSGKTIGFVPTMGALHDGHLSLIDTARSTADITLCSIFVNPTQFNDIEDFLKYPEMNQKDLALLHKASCNVVFLPSVPEIYPDGTKKRQKRNFGFLAKTLEEEFRPGHFNGMVQVVERLLQIVQPDFLFMGQKDYQQQLIVADLIGLMKIKTKLVVCPIVREKDGLAMSSRNARLSRPKRKLATEISKTLNRVKALFDENDLSISKLQFWGGKHLSHCHNIAVEYFEIRNARTLKPAKSRREKLIALVAVRIGNVRLIDNLLLN
ncbi:MAG: pantoate--beta-alanine ligase [Bacteroidetes bacterium]|nr:pantoate--beta-alanine ligase [Bacteroidota bacterium]